MVRTEDIPRLLAGETDRVEYKQSTGQRDHILRAVCALANDLGASSDPGFVVIGVDKFRTVLGVEGHGSIDEQQQELASRLRSSKIQPVPSTSISVLQHDGHTLIVIEVQPYPVPPIVEVDAAAWVRLGSTTQRATRADLQRLNERRPANAIPFDTRPLAGATVEDLDTTSLRSAWAAARESDGDSETFPDFDTWLVQRQYARRDRGNVIPNAAAILTHGESPQDLLPCAWIDMVRYDGTDVDTPVVTRRAATGTLADQLEVAWTWVSAQIESIPDVADGIRETFVPMYPIEALKELVRNLVQHRLYEGTNAPGRIEWYKDRIEFSNPGGPFGRASEGEFGTQSDYRNPLLTARLVEAGYVQQLGRGVRRVRLDLEKNGNPPLEVEVDGFTRVTIWGRR